MNTMKSALVVLALLASLVGGYLVGVAAPNVPFPLSALHQTDVHQLLATGGGTNPGGTAVHQLLANGGSGSGGDPGSG